MHVVLSQFGKGVNNFLKGARIFRSKPSGGTNSCLTKYQFTYIKSESDAGTASLREKFDMERYRIFLRFYEELNDFLPVERRKVQFAHTLAGKASIKDVIESFGVPHTEVDLILVNQRSVDFAYIVQPEDVVSVYPVFEAFDITPLDGYYVRATNPQRQVAEVVQRFQLTPQGTLFSRCTVCNNVLIAVDKGQILHRLSPNTQVFYQQCYYCQDCDKLYWQGSHYHNMRQWLREICP